MARHRAPRPRPSNAARLVLLTAAAALAAAVPMATADAAAARPAGHVDHGVQQRGGVISVRGWAYDPARSTASLHVDFLVDGHPTRRVLANGARGDVDRALRIHGRHGYSTTFQAKAGAKVLSVYAHPASGRGAATLIGVSYLNGYRPPTASRATRVIAEARKYVGRSPYVDGGTTPRGFDCSGYTQYVYAHAGAPRLPRTAEQQRRAMRRVSAAAARPGDLVFYLSGGAAYHVAIYAGHGMQYAAATPRDGLRYQAVWSSAVQYGTLLH
jgi:hypothetical protein